MAPRGLSPSKQTFQVSEVLGYPPSIHVDWDIEEWKWSSGIQNTRTWSKVQTDGLALRSRAPILVKGLANIRHSSCQWRGRVWALQQGKSPAASSEVLVKSCTKQPKLVKPYWLSPWIKLGSRTEQVQPYRQLSVGRILPHLVYWTAIKNLLGLSLCCIPGKYCRDVKLAALFLLGELIRMWQGSNL